MDVALTPGQCDATEQAWSAAADLLEAGAQSAEAVRLAELVHAAHSCRVAGLPRLSGAGARVAQHLRDMHARRPESSLAALTRDFQELLATAHALRSTETPSREWIGQARRAYTEVGELDLVGIFTEPIASTGGYAGVVTYFVDHENVIWSLGDIAPGGADRCRWAYVTPLELGGATMEHRALCRQALHLEHATAAGNRRLGMGKRVRPELGEPVSWAHPRLARRWHIPLELQLDGAWTSRSDGGAGDDLVFVRSTVVGALDDALVVRVGSRVLRCIAPSAHKELAYRCNLRSLAASPGRDCLMIGRVAFSQPRTMFLLAVKPIDGEAMTNMGLDPWPRPPSVRERRGGVRWRRQADPPIEAVVDPLEPLTRRLRQVLLGGRPTLALGALSAFVADEELLVRRQLATGAQLLREVRAQTDRSGLAHAWLRARTYLVAASARLQRLDWLT